MDTRRSLLLPLGLALVYLLLGLGFVLVVPPGEAPDEPAHVRYVDTIVRDRSLPPLPATRGGNDYESYQPPLDYAVSAAWLLATGGKPVDYPFTPSGSLDFHRQGSRAIVVRTDAPAREAASRLRRLRAFHLVWGLIALLAVVETVRLVTENDDRRVLLSVAPFVLAPQFLFIAAAVNNDGALIALSALTLHSLVALLLGRGAAKLHALVAGVAAGLALWTKFSAVVLLPALLYVCYRLFRRGERPAARRVLASYSIAFLAWLAFEQVRFQDFLPPPPTGFASSLSVVPHLFNPYWIGSLWISFWAKFGWLNVWLPLALYVVFLPPTLWVFRGLVGAVSARAETPVSEVEASRLAGVLLLTNVLLVVLYMTTVDWQPQGRYLFPSLGAMAILSAGSLRAARLACGLGNGWLASVVGVAAASIFTVYFAYAGG